MLYIAAAALTSMSIWFRAARIIVFTLLALAAVSLLLLALGNASISSIVAQRLAASQIHRILLVSSTALEPAILAQIGVIS